jgi:hypothetical protein
MMGLGILARERSAARACAAGAHQRTRTNAAMAQQAYSLWHGAQFRKFFGRRVGRRVKLRTCSPTHIVHMLLDSAPPCSRCRALEAQAGRERGPRPAAPPGASHSREHWDVGRAGSVWRADPTIALQGLLPTRRISPLTVRSQSAHSPLTAAVMSPKPKSKHSETRPSQKAKVTERRADKALREHQLDDFPLLQGLGLRRVFRLGPIGVDGGEPAVALWRAVCEVITKQPGWLAFNGHTVVYEYGASSGDYDYDAGRGGRPAGRGASHLPAVGPEARQRAQGAAGEGTGRCAGSKCRGDGSRAPGREPGGLLRAQRRPGAHHALRRQEGPRRGQQQEQLRGSAPSQVCGPSGVWLYTVFALYCILCLPYTVFARSRKAWGTSHRALIPV